MITRIVKMQFKASEIDAFKQIFAQSKDKILATDGCEAVKLVQDNTNPCIMMTISKWRDEDALNAYRKSELFGSIWPKTKILFDAKPEAWSLTEIK